MKQYTATTNDDGVRLSRFVQSVTRDFPTSLLYKSFRNKRVKVNGKKAAPEYRLQAGDLIESWRCRLCSNCPAPARRRPASGCP